MPTNKFPIIVFAAFIWISEVYSPIIKGDDKLQAEAGFAPNTKDIAAILNVVAAT